MKTNISYHIFMALLGLLMGGIMVYTGFTDFTEVHNMFIFSDFRLLFGFAGAVGLAMIGFFIINKGKTKTTRKLHKGTIPGAVMFGTGWALTGACPTIALVQIGQGQLAALFTAAGIFFGAWSYRYLSSGSLKLDTEICGDD